MNRLHIWFVAAALLIAGCSSSPGTEIPKTAIPTNPIPAATTLNQPTNPPSRVPEETITPAPTSSPTSAQAEVEPVPGAIVVDHRSIELFDIIPEQYLAAAQDLSMIYLDRSVGKNIDDGLNCLQFTSTSAAPNHCSRVNHVDPAYSISPADLSWQRQGGYPRPKWIFEAWPNNGCAAWHEKVDCFLQYIEPIIDQYDVVSYQLSYLAVDNDSDIAEVPGGYFSDNANLTDVYDQDHFERQYPDTIFIYWTTSLARNIGTSVATSFNQQMREYSLANGKPLFDVAAILSHAPDGTPCYDNRDGVEYDNGNNQENHPDDGEQFPAICPHYTTEVEGGHLGRVSAGKIRAAKGFWVLMAQIAGWSP